MRVWPASSSLRNSTTGIVGYCCSRRIAALSGSPADLSLSRPWRSFCKRPIAEMSRRTWRKAGRARKVAMSSPHSNDREQNTFA